MAELLRLRLYPERCLRLPALEAAPGEQALLEAEQMERVMESRGGVGLAANQVGLLKRLVVVRPDREQAALALLNPRVVSSSSEREVEQEGCLSLPGLPVPVERALAVGIEALTPLGEPLRLELSGYPARVVQHELDHLDGILIQDKALSAAKPAVMRLLRDFLPYWRRGLVPDEEVLRASFRAVGLLADGVSE